MSETFVAAFTILALSLVLVVLAANNPFLFVLAVIAMPFVIALLLKRIGH